VASPVDPQGAQAGAIGGNLSQLSNLYQLATGMGSASGAGASANLNTALPGASNALGQELGVAESDLAGQISPSTLANLEQVSAERGVSTGDIGSPNSNAALMSLLGNTTEQLQQTGVQDLTSAINSAPVGPQFDPSSMNVTPALDISALQTNSANAAQPNGSAAAAADMAALQAGLAAGKGPAKVGVLPTGTTGGTGANPAAGIGGSGLSQSDQFMNSPWASDTPNMVGYGPQGQPQPAGTTATGGYQEPTYGGIPTGDTVGGTSMDPTGNEAFAKDFPGQQLEPGQTYNPQSGMIEDQNSGTAYDPGTGLTFSLETGEVVADTGGGDTSGGEPAYAGGDTGGGDFSGE
jgi:hypothetical protein